VGAPVASKAAVGGVELDELHIKSATKNDGDTTAMIDLPFIDSPAWSTRCARNFSPRRRLVIPDGRRIRDRAMRGGRIVDG
jgi:hypothetical protein